MLKPSTSPPVFNNADSFALAFDEAWKLSGGLEAHQGRTSSEKIDQILGQLHEHPFVVENPELARQVAEFRVRLLGL